MISRNPFLLAISLLTVSALATAADTPRQLRVCADPDNLPFSNDRMEGFENKIAEVIAKDLNAHLEWVWAAQSPVTVRQTLNANKCDLLVGAPAQWSPVLTTRPYYASTYVFVYRKNKHKFSSFDDPALHNLKIGLTAVASGGSNPPPAYALADRGLTANIVGFPIYPPARIFEAVASGAVDTAIVWGPIGGYFAKKQRLAATPVSPGDRDASLRFTFEMSMGVRWSDAAFKDELEKVLDRRQTEIHKLLEDYGVPMLPLDTVNDEQTKLVSTRSK
jgi:quinoprotein dehydrogenase-associated probable ABC transporter substrate-binding protein